jgi:serine/threonine protein kinase/formylglycine-generating enzyme required for sulfatase activity
MAKSSTNGKDLDGSTAEDPVVSPRELATIEFRPDADAAAGSADVDDGLAKGTSVGRYMVLERLGSGAMGVVYAAYDPELDRKVALKLLRPHRGSGDLARAQERLVREAQAIAKVSHPNVVGIFDVGVHDGQVFLAMEYLAGGTLREWLATRQHDWRDVVEIFVGVGRGLAAAHAEGLIHRDFKPDNVLLDKNGAGKVVDFGLVRLTGSLGDTPSGPLDAAAARAALQVPETPVAAAPRSGSAALTRTGAIMGTPAFMAPEQFLGKAVDARTDQFAFCVSLYEALYGDRPFPGDSLVTLADSVTSGRIREAPRDSAVPGWLRRVILKGLSVDPADRHASFSDLLRALSDNPVARRARRLSVGAALVAAIVLVGGLQRRSEQRRSELEHRIAARLADADQAFTQAQSLKDRVSLLRNRSFGLFDVQDADAGERLWAEARAASAALDATLGRAEGALEAALGLDHTRVEARRRLGDVVYERASLAELELRREDLARHLIHLQAVDTSGQMMQRWRQPGSLAVRTVPAGAQIGVDRFESDGAPARLTGVPVGAGMTSPLASYALAPGSYALHIQKPGYADTLYPFVVRRGETVSADVALPRDTDVPQGLRYVPAGRFLFGDHDEDWRVSFLNAVPLHERDASGFLIAAHETTFADWIAFVSTLPAAERKARLPASPGVHGSVKLVEGGAGQWTLHLDISRHPLQAAAGEKIVYPGRPQPAAAQDWLQMPVIGVSVRDMRAYLAWLSASGRVPGARLCRDTEWERAARGADERSYPASSLRLAPGDANVDATYGRVPGAYGPDQVGRHPESRSPFGLDDMAGNAWEVVESDHAADAFLIRGGCYYEMAISARSTNREPIEIETRSHIVGFRVCADWPKPNKPKG